MNKITVAIMSVLLLTLGLILPGCVTFSAQTKEFSAVVTKLAADQTALNNIVLGWHNDVLKAYKLAKQTEARDSHEAATGERLPLDAFVVEIPMTNPAYDPANPGAEPEYLYKDIDEIIKNIDDLMEMNLQIAESLDTLNESIQADVGIDPLFQEVKKILEDEQVMALIKLYAEELRKKNP